MTRYGSFAGSPTRRAPSFGARDPRRWLTPFVGLLLAAVAGGCFWASFALWLALR